IEQQKKKKQTTNTIPPPTNHHTKKKFFFPSFNAKHLPRSFMCSRTKSSMRPSKFTTGCLRVLAPRFFPRILARQKNSFPLWEATVASRTSTWEQVEPR